MFRFNYRLQIRRPSGKNSKYIPKPSWFNNVSISNIQGEFGFSKRWEEILGFPAEVGFLRFNPGGAGPGDARRNNDQLLKDGIGQTQPCFDLKH